MEHINSMTRWKCSYYIDQKYGDMSFSLEAKRSRFLPEFLTPTKFAAVKLDNFFIIKSDNSETTCQLLSDTNTESSGKFWNHKFQKECEFGMIWDMDVDVFVSKLIEKGYTASVDNYGAISIKMKKPEI